MTLDQLVEWPSRGTSAGDETVNKQQSSDNFGKVSMNWIYCQQIYFNVKNWKLFKKLKTLR